MCGSKLHSLKSAFARKFPGILSARIRRWDMRECQVKPSLNPQHVQLDLSAVRESSAPVDCQLGTDSVGSPHPHPTIELSDKIDRI